MQYNSFLYLFVFLFAAVVIYYIFPQKYRWTVLLVSSVGFYYISSRLLIVILPITTLALYFAALKIDKNKSNFKEKKNGLDKEKRKKLKAFTEHKNKIILALFCVLAFSLLFFSKYYNFAGENINVILKAFSASLRIPVIRIFMPLGISFYTLSAVSYIADVHHGICHAQTNYFKLLLFLMFFPVIVEGPISRYSQLGSQLYENHKFDYKTFCFGLQLILWGLIQKVVIADRLNRYVGFVFKNQANYSGIVILTAIVLYTFQIYMDFSGCVDIARGSAQLFGINLAENFRRPFFAISVNDFWRRWHITLGAWLRDYIFYPLSMSKGFQKIGKASRKHLNSYYAATVPALIALLGVWLGNGIWHGAEWKYIFYGIYYYLITACGMLFEPLILKTLKSLKLNREQNGYKAFQIIRTFVLVNIGMLIFRADSIKVAFSMLISVFKPFSGSFEDVLNTNGLSVQHLALIVLCAICVLVISILREKKISIRESIAERPIAIRWVIYIVAILIVVVVGAYGPGFKAGDFIYAQF